MRPVLKGYLRLARPANLPTALADILAGLGVSGLFGAEYMPAPFNSALLTTVVLLGMASIALYAGGVVLNDVFDAGIDRLERPERPIPSGLIPLRSASVFGALLLLAGVALSFIAHPFSGFIACMLLIAILLYDGVLKKYPVLGPLNMGICRGLNLLLGMSAVGSLIHWWYAFIPVAYIFAITMISRGEVHGENRNHIIWAGLLYALVNFSVVYIVILHPENALGAILVLGLFSLMIYTPLIRAYRENNPGNIRKAVMAGVLSVIILDAAIAVIFMPWWYGLLILLLWPLSRMLSKLFAVT
jgi:4-hydroxybenzoate polyprenyltransferase